MMHDGNLSIGFIGAGRVGVTLGRYFIGKNLTVSGYFSKTYAHACEAAAFTHSKSCQTMEELVKSSQVIFITVPDAGIHEVCLQLKDYELRDKILCHCSGALSARVFAELESKGAYGYSVHPVFAINDKENSYKEISKACFTVEGNEEKLSVIRELFVRLGNPVQVISGENKDKYHASMVMASNLVIGLYHMSKKLLEECGFSAASSGEVLNPLFLNNAVSICEKGCAGALTGPVDRNDVPTVKKHLAAFAKTGNAAATEVYLRLSEELLEIAKEKYPDREYEEMKRALCENL
ncbi:MAG: DUF2520 domain-containing protein [Lachnospiraceae bacterium]|nr:DUF2520 domain-containing protein [Lachnospiraceae bacterium]